ncbi:MAG: sarcosine oxidase subunit gamma [Gammaproteobacteria bacterium]|nr:sarcosine oxidase subunit gamma [Gammaproteobacteria bacterium]
MSNTVVAESPLVRFKLNERAAKGTGNAGVIVNERALLGHVNLRGDAQDPRFVSAASQVLGVDVPTAANTVHEAQGNTVYWLGPNEWLIVTTGERATALVGELRKALAGLFVAVTEVSGGQTVLVFRGRSARALFTKECPLDLHPRSFRVGQCAQTHLAKAPILIRQLDGEPTYEIVVRRSFSDYLWLWLESAAAEYGLAMSK